MPLVLPLGISNGRTPFLMTSPKKVLKTTGHLLERQLENKEILQDREIDENGLLQRWRL